MPGMIPPFQSAQNNGHTNTVKMLLLRYAEFNIDVDAKDLSGWTHLHFAC